MQHLCVYVSTVKEITKKYYFFSLNIICDSIWTSSVVNNDVEMKAASLVPLCYGKIQLICSHHISLFIRVCWNTEARRPQTNFKVRSAESPLVWSAAESHLQLSQQREKKLMLVFVLFNLIWADKALFMIFWSCALASVSHCSYATKPSASVFGGKANRCWRAVIFADSL